MMPPAECACIAGAQIVAQCEAGTAAGAAAGAGAAGAGADAGNVNRAAACSSVVAAWPDAPPREYDTLAAWQHRGVLTAQLHSARGYPVALPETHAPWGHGSTAAVQVHQGDRTRMLFWEPAAPAPCFVFVGSG